jgi:hypothetical protein
MIQFPFEPVFTEQLNRGLRANSVVPAAQVVRQTVFIASQHTRSGCFGFEANLCPHGLACKHFGGRSGGRRAVEGLHGA